MSYLPETHGAAVYADVTSANIVGYMGETLNPAKFNMISIPFNTVDGKGIDLNNENDIKIENHSETGDVGDEGTDFIQVWRSEFSGYDNFYYYADETAWCAADGTDTPFIECPGYENGFPAGSTAWYLANADWVRPGDLKITVSGAVATEDDTTYTLNGAKYNMVANPYPVAIDFNNPEQVVITNHSETGDVGDEGTDFIQVWHPEFSGYDNFYYYADEEKWCAADGSDTPFIECEGYEDGLPAGKAFWYLANGDWDRAGDLTIKFINPINK